MKAGRTGSDVRAVTECVPPGVPALALCRPSENIDASEIDAEVRRLLLVNPLKWYAMRLRPRVKFRQLSERFGRMETEKAAVPEIFYPCDEIVRRTDGRLTAEDRPVISDIVFSAAASPIFFRSSARSATWRGATVRREASTTNMLPSRTVRSASFSGQSGISRPTTRWRP